MKCIMMKLWWYHSVIYPEESITICSCSDDLGKKFKKIKCTPVIFQECFMLLHPGFFRILSNSKSKYYWIKRKWNDFFRHWDKMRSLELQKGKRHYSFEDLFYLLSFDDFTEMFKNRLFLVVQVIA